MNQQQTIVPRLKHYTWTAKDQVVCRKLTDMVDLLDVPWVAFGYDRPDTIQFINRDQLHELEMSEQDIEAEALHNLRTHPARWNRHEVETETSAKLELLICSGDYFASEQLLNRDFMRSAERLLNTNALAVAVPYSGALLAMSGNLGQANNLHALIEFTFVIGDMYSNPESQAITAIVFKVVDGEIVGQLSTSAPEKTNIN